MKFGTDPEYLVVNRLGRPVPAHKAGIPDKEHKMVLHKPSWPVDTKAWESRCFRDGYMVEINIQPDTCRQTTTFRMQRALRALQRKLHPRYMLVSVPAVRINLARDMKDAPPDVQQFGCEPSYDAYDAEAKLVPIDAMTHPLRYAGGHLHFGYSGYPNLSWMETPANHLKFVKLLDLYLGLPLTYLFDSKQTFQRRKFYGQAGEFRSQKYGPHPTAIGVEYRTPGPEVWNAPWVASFALGVGRHVGRHFKMLAKKWDKSIEDDLRLAINDGQGIERMLKLAKLPGYHEYPKSFLPLKQHAPTKLQLHHASTNVVDAGWADWAYSHNVAL